MRVPDTGQPLYERRIVREGMRLAERMLEGYEVKANGRFVRRSNGKYGDAFAMAHAQSWVNELLQRAVRSIR
ncbi:hypothetical protein [Devosia chinhatensis]|uniref:hypothetical protein n=1 Tax=Devosia chinhatensis TaxID=429727 RepID=UPI00128E56FF|nr:hypothetical protein [Devosia chinhatensis]